MASPDIRTNRDLYLAIAALVEEKETCERSLEAYLRALLPAGERFASHESISIDAFFALLTAAFTEQMHPFDDQWRTQYDELPNEAPGFDGWRATLIRQIVDLHEMEESGVLEARFRSFGVDSPRNSRWYNFDPPGYLESALAGAFGRWEPGAATRRRLVPGNVAVRRDDGSITDADPRDLLRPQTEMPAITWNQFKDFVYCGQTYE